MTGCSSSSCRGHTESLTQDLVEADLGLCGLLFVTGNRLQRPTSELFFFFFELLTRFGLLLGLDPTDRLLSVGLLAR